MTTPSTTLSTIVVTTTTLTTPATTPCKTLFFPDTKAEWKCFNNPPLSIKILLVNLQAALDIRGGYVPPKPTNTKTLNNKGPLFFTVGDIFMSFLLLKCTKSVDNQVKYPWITNSVTNHKPWIDETENNKPADNEGRLY